MVLIITQAATRGTSTLRGLSCLIVPYAINMICNNHATFLALPAIVSAVASGQPARDYENIHPSIVSKTLQSQHEKRAPQNEEQDEVYQIECRMRRMCRPAPKTSSPIQDPAAKSTSIDQSILDWVSILNAPGPVMTELPQVITTSTNNMDRDITSEDSSALKTIAVTYPVQSPSRLWPITFFSFRGRCPPSLPKSATRYSPRHGTPDYIVCLRNKTRTTVLVAKEMPARRARGRVEEGSNEKRQAVEGFLDSNRQANSNYKHKATLMFEKVKSEKGGIFQGSPLPDQLLLICLPFPSFPLPNPGAR
ncbi:hypothetical protein D6C84_01507 [Aureobasidium pullulans]|uniref:Uncharacterized protein n=1 Tax=Aureobasidium pullulans TaxID=5580 RepID=A0A4S9Y7L0_AURPU|nr:hypothetical protein D6C84_01507 [Aureobasidium pullulans]